MHFLKNIYKSAPIFYLKTYSAIWHGMRYKHEQLTYEAAPFNADKTANTTT